MSSASNTRGQRRTLLQLAIAGALALGAGQAFAASVTLCATPYTQGLPGPNNTSVAVPMWGYSLGACGAAAPTSPGPLLVVPPGDTTLTVTLQNNLTVPTSIVIAGQKLPAGGAPVRAADVVGAACAATATDLQCRVRSFTSETAPGATGTYSFSNLKPGSYLYQSGTHQQVQVQMGLFGMMALDGQAAAVAQRQLTTNPATIIDADVSVVLSEIDPDQHARIQATLGSTDLAAQQTWQSGGNSTFAYSPRFFLVNGKPFDGNNATDLPAPTFNGAYVGLRLANAGLKSRTLMLTRGHWELLTEDGNDYAAPREQFTALLPAGKTSDARLLVSVPATGTSRLAFFDRRGGTDNSAGDAMGGQVAQLVLSNGGTVPPNIADLAITKTDGIGSVQQGGATVYTIVATNNGPNPVIGATVSDAMPAALSAASWTCTAGAGASCPASGTGNIAATVNLAVGASVSFTVNATVSATATGTLVNTATITPPAGFNDRVATNNSATDADAIISPVADLTITNSNGVAAVVAGAPVSYVLVASNPAAVGTGVGQSNTAVTATIADTVPLLGGVTWSCVATAGSTCSTASGSGALALPVTLAKGGSATVTLTGTLPVSATGTLANTATLTLPAGTGDPNPADNTATDSDPVVTPVQTVLDDFNRANAVGLGSNWSQVLGGVGLGINGNEAVSLGIAPVGLWNTTFGSKQGAAFTITNGTLNNDSLILKASGSISGLNGQPTNFIRVRASATAVVVATTTNGNALTGGTFTTRATFNTPIATGTRLTAVANADGSVDVWKAAGGVLSYLGRSPAAGMPAVFVNAGGRIGINLPTAGARVDDFAGGTIAP